MWMHVEWILFHNPVTTQCKLYVCGEISWWTGQALIFGRSYTKFPQMNTDVAQQFSTSWRCGSMADIDRSSWASSSGVWRSWNEMNRVLFSHSYCNTWVSRSADCYQIFQQQRPNFHVTIKFTLHCVGIKCLIGRYWNSRTRYVTSC